MGRRAVLLLGVCALVATAGGAQAGGPAGVAITAPPPLAVKAWRAESDNVVAARGTVTLDGAAVSGVRVRVDRYEVPAPTDAAGHFATFVDDTLLGRHVVSVSDASGARTATAPLTSAQRAALSATRSAITVAYPLRAVRVSRDGSGQPVITGTISGTPGAAPPAVSLYSYELTGTVTDANGKPVAGAFVSTRTLDRDYWTVSTPTDAHGRFSSLFTASDEAGHDPVPLTVRVARGDVVYQFLPQEYVRFERLHSARLDLKLPPRGYPFALPLPRSYPGAIFEGLVVGAAQGERIVRPVRVTWPDAEGRFTIVLPRTLAGRTVSLWEGKLDLFSHAAATPGGAIDLRDWPSALEPTVPRDLVRVTLR